MTMMVFLAFFVFGLILARFSSCLGFIMLGIVCLMAILALAHAFS